MPADDTREPTEPPTPPDASEPATGDTRRLERDVNGLAARVDQLDSEVRALDITVVLIAFAFGALAGLLYLQARQLSEVRDALAS